MNEHLLYFNSWHDTLKKSKSNIVQWKHIASDSVILTLHEYERPRQAVGDLSKKSFNKFRRKHNKLNNNSNELKNLDKHH